MGRIAEMEITKVENVMTHENEIKLRVPRQWLVNKTNKKINMYIKSKTTTDKVTFNNIITNEVSKSNQNQLEQITTKQRLTHLKRRRQETLEHIEKNLKVSNVTSPA